MIVPLILRRKNKKKEINKTWESRLNFSKFIFSLSGRKEVY